MIHRGALPPAAIREATEELRRLIGGSWEGNYSSMSVTAGDTTWELDDIDEFIGEYARHEPLAMGYFFRLDVTTEAGSSKLQIHSSEHFTSIYVDIELPNRGQIEQLHQTISQSITPYPEPIPLDPGPEVFIGHGRAPDWKDLRDHLQDAHGIKVHAFESGSRAGHTIRDILEELLDSSTMAFLVLTKEDEIMPGDAERWRARQNVIHEAGLFQGRLGFPRAILVVEEGVEMFSNSEGIQQLRFPGGQIRGVFGDVVAAIRREFPTL